MDDRIFLFMAMVGLASTASLAAVDGNASIRGESQPVLFEPNNKPCMPKKYSTKIIPLKSVSSGKLNFWDTQVDYTRNLQVMLNYTGSEEPENKVVIDYNKGILYSVATKFPDYCFKMNYTMPLIECLPDDASYMGSSYLGALASGELPYDGWSFKLKGMAVTIAMTKKSSVPLVETVSSPSGDQYFMFSGFQANLTDPSAFNLPKSCFK